MRRMSSSEMCPALKVSPLLPGNSQHLLTQAVNLPTSAAATRGLVCPSNELACVAWWLGCILAGTLKSGRGAKCFKLVRSDSPSAKNNSLPQKKNEKKCKQPKGEKRRSPISAEMSVNPKPYILYRYLYTYIYNILYQTSLSCEKVGPG